VLDSSQLRMSSVGFVSPNDPMWASTLAVMDGQLITDSLVYRYGPPRPPPACRAPSAPSHSARSSTSFYVDALARAGRREDASRVRKMLTYANHVGLYSEEITLSGVQVGNFPLAFSHLALVDAAITLDKALDRVPPDDGRACMRSDLTASSPRSPTGSRGR
jgi:GH15 family glucan-1,4-alpha-glucosidase